ncbi:MAG: hypothetical protein CBB68_07370 [Rhodospirillaceae bacterium TMED8]|nr:phytoene synthase [Magnetovibrio sp.]OUT50807.1 MAG: hypothetical protein CBB68_07370 [Rhodospirillaceae bacterium TMED8]|tara:strand:+ start:2232 stop:3164 length:933 start_codon:yes stop_codon:yes gene_type:complete
MAIIDSSPRIETSDGQIFKESASSFYFASYWLNNDDFNAIANLYALCRKVDNIADGDFVPEKAYKQLESIQTALTDGDKSNTTVNDFFAIQPLINPAFFDQLITGAKRDTQGVSIRNERDLIRYCFRVAGSVGLMICDVLGVRDYQATACAIDLGIAMQLTNIARDISEDAELGRRYLPETWVGDLKPPEILKPTAQQKFLIKKAVLKLLQEADKRYISGFRGLPFLKPRVRFVVLLAGRVYRRIGIKIRRRNCDIWSGRVYTGPVEKLYELVIALIVFFFDRRIRCYTGIHELDLHRDLDGLLGPYQEK